MAITYDTHVPGEAAVCQSAGMRFDRSAVCDGGHLCVPQTAGSRLAALQCSK